MKFSLFSVFLILHISAFSQNLQLHYDFRHSIDPKLNPGNYPTFSFEYFKNADTLGTGSFLLKLQTDLNGKNNNVGQCFVQASKSLKFWDPNVYLYLTYSGGLGVTPSSFGYYLYNSYGVGVSTLLFWNGVWIVPSVCFRVNAFDRPSYDPQFTIYFGRGFINYKVFTAGSFTFWTQNRNKGHDYAKDLEGKKFVFFGDPQIWVKIKNKFSVGSRINIYYNLLSENQIQVYPTFGIKHLF